MSRLPLDGCVAVVSGANHGIGAATSWKVIDPHGQRGDRHAEVWPLLEATAAFPACERRGDRRLAWRWVEAYADAAEMEAERAAAWASLLTRAQAYGYDARTPCDEEERAWAASLHRLADALAEDLSGGLAELGRR